MGEESISQTTSLESSTTTTTTTTTTGCECPTITSTNPTSPGGATSSTTTTIDLSSSESPQVTQVTGIFLPSGECYCGTQEEIEEETTTDMPVFNQRDIVLDKFDQEMIRKINLLNY